MYSVSYMCRNHHLMFLTPSDPKTMMMEFCYLRALYPDDEKYYHTFSVKKYSGKKYSSNYIYIVVDYHKHNDGYELDEAEKNVATLLKNHPEKIQYYVDLINLAKSWKA